MTGETITGLSMGHYGVTATDANGCEITDWAFVDFVSKTVDYQAVAPFILFPNPTNGAAALKGHFNAATKVDLQVFNAMGQLVLMKNDALPHNGELDFDLQHQPPGLYQVVVLGADGMLFEGKISVKR